MPTYEYECEKCGRIFEEYQSIIAKQLTKCKFEGCDGPVKRILSAGAGFILKGSGFYSTDYRSDSYKKQAQSEKSSTTPGTDTSKKPASSTPPAAGTSSSAPASK